MVSSAPRTELCYQIRIIQESEVRLSTKSGMEKQLHPTVSPAQSRSGLRGELGLPTAPANPPSDGHCCCSLSQGREAEHPLATSHPKVSG